MSKKPMIELNPEIFTMSKKRFVLKAFSENYLGNIDIAFDDWMEFEKATVGLSLKLISLYLNEGTTIPLQNEMQLKQLLETPNTVF